MPRLLASALAALALAAIAGAAHAGDPGFCRDYARSALEQYHQAERMDCRQVLADRAAWSPDFNYHYNWCLHVRRSSAYDSQSQRNNELQQCQYRGHGYGHDYDRDHDHDRDDDNDYGDHDRWRH